MDFVISARTHLMTSLQIVLECLTGDVAIRVTKFLLEHGARINIEDFNPPIFLALKHHGTEMVKLLIEHGADLNFQPKFAHTNCFKIVFERYQEDETFDYGDYIKYCKLLIENGIDIDHEVDNCRSLLSEACSDEDFDFVRYLVEHGADVNRDCGDGYTAISFLPRLMGEIFDYLIENGGNIDESKYEEYTALQDAVWKKDYDRVQNLLDRGANINHEGCAGDTPLMIAEDDPQMVEYLLARGADPFWENEDGRMFVTNYQELVDIVRKY